MNIQEEKETGLKLPESLITLYEAKGNGGFGPEYGMLGIVSGHETDLGDTMLSLYKAFCAGDKEDCNWKWPQELIPFIHIGCAIHYCINSKEKEYPIVKFDPNGYDEEKGWEKHFIKTRISFMEFLGDPEGNGVSALRFDVGKILRQFSQVENAYFSKLKYKGEDKIRIGLIVIASESLHELGKEIAHKCAGISPMDVLFSNNCAHSLIQNIKENSEPLFIDTNLLFECPIVVSSGTNEDMPKEWKGAIISYYVAAPDYEAALNRAANDLKSDGYKFEDVYEGKVIQLDPTVWWDQYVMEKWSEYADDFPSQEDIEVIVITGGIHKGPALGWGNEKNNT